MVVLAWLACISIAVADDVAVKPDAKVVTDPLDHYQTAGLEESTRHDALIRIRRDFNNDGRDDQAFAFRSVCGNKMCHFDLWLQDQSRRYRLVGYLPILPWGYGLVPREGGIAELQTCSGRGGEFWEVSAYRIGADGVTPDSERNKLPSKAGECPVAELDSYPCETCWMKELVKSNRCRWKACD